MSTGPPGPPKLQQHGATSVGIGSDRLGLACGRRRPLLTADGGAESCWDRGRNSRPMCSAARHARRARGPVRSGSPPRLTTLGHRGVPGRTSSSRRSRARACSSPSRTRERLNRVEMNSREGDRHPSASSAEVPDRTAGAEARRGYYETSGDGRGSAASESRVRSRRPMNRPWFHDPDCRCQRGLTRC